MDVQGLLLDHLAKLVVLAVELVKEGPDQGVLPFDDPSEDGLLLLNLTVELLALIDFLQFRPFELERGVALVSLVAFVLDLVVALESPTLFLGSSFLLALVVLHLDGGQLLSSRANEVIDVSAGALHLIGTLGSALSFHRS